MDRNALPRHARTHAPGWTHPYSTGPWSPFLYASGGDEDGSEEPEGSDETDGTDGSDPGGEGPDGTDGEDGEDPDGADALGKARPGPTERTARTRTAPTRWATRASAPWPR